jgi:hypothetical protein
MISVLFFSRRLFYTRARLLLARVGVRALVCRRRRRQRACARRVPESKDFGRRKKVNTNPFFFVFFPRLRRLSRVEDVTIRTQS